MRPPRLSKFALLSNSDLIVASLIWLLFVILAVPVIAFEQILSRDYSTIVAVALITVLISLAAAFYIHNYQKRIIRNRGRALALVGVFVFLLATTKAGILLTSQIWWATSTAVAAAIILSIAYDQRFAIALTTFYCLYATFAANLDPNMKLFLTMMAGAATCCFCLREIRTRMKLLEVSVLAACVIFATSVTVFFLEGISSPAEVFAHAGMHALTAFLVGLIIQSLLPLIEKVFRIATSMTLLDYSDANQPLLKKLALEAPGTFSHSLLIGSIAEAAAEAIDRNGLLCRVGAYYHDIGKINKSSYFVENEMGSTSRHKQLSPAMSQLIIVGHVKDGIEMAKEYGLPAVLRQFIETHHGTTLVEYFYNEAKKKKQQKAGRESAPAESEFRYSGPKPRTKEAAIVMLADVVEGAVRSVKEVTPPKIEAVVHNMAMKRLQDGQFDECDLTLRELSKIETAMSKALAAHYHGRIAYPERPEVTNEDDRQSLKNNKENQEPGPSETHSEA